MKHITSLAIGASLLATTSAFAQNTSDGVYYSGNVQAEYYDFDGGNEDAIYGNAIIGYTTSAGAALNWGAELGVEALRFDGETFKVLTPTVFVDTDYGRFTVGAPKSAAETYAIQNEFSANGALSLLEFGVLFNSAPHYVALFDDEIVLGARYDYKVGNTAFGLSYHQHDVSGDSIDMFGVGVRHSFETVDVFATYENVNSTVIDEDVFSVGAEGHYLAMDYGVEYQSGSVVGADNDTVYAYLDYNVNDQFVVGAEVTNISDGSDDFTLYGINADYTFWRNAYVGASYIDGSDSFDSFFTARLGWKF